MIGIRCAARRSRSSRQLAWFGSRRFKSRTEMLASSGYIIGLVGAAQCLVALAPVGVEPII